jgi:NhaP-type Na+/H+ or K+/H+ antiporter
MNPTTPHAQPEDKPRMTRRERAWALIVTLASIVVATFFIWIVIDEDSLPHAFGIPLLIAAVITVADAVARIVRERRS